MNTKIANAKTTFFTDKQHYLNFRKAWAESANTANVTITAAHHLAFNLLRGHESTRGFTPITNRNKLANGAAINFALYTAYNDLKHIVWYIQQIAQEKIQLEQTIPGQKLSDRKILSLNESIQYKQKQLDKFLAPFKGTVSPETIIALMAVAPNIEKLESNYGPGKAIAAQIIGSDRKITYQDIWALYGR